MPYRILPIALALAVAAPAHASHVSNSSGLVGAATFDRLVDTLDAADTAIDAIAFDAGGDWIVVADGTVHASSGFDATLVRESRNSLASGASVLAISCRSDGLCMLIDSSRTVTVGGTAPSALTSRLADLRRAGVRVDQLALDPSGGWVVFAGAHVYSDGLATDFQAALDDLAVSGRTLQSVSIDASGGWSLIADNNPMYGDLPSAHADALGILPLSRPDLDPGGCAPGGGPAGTYLYYDAEDLTFTPSGPWGPLLEKAPPGETIWDRMAEDNIQGLSVTLIEDGEVVETRSYGRTADGEQDILTDTIFSIASISKFVGALTTLEALETGGLDVPTALDKDILTWTTVGSEVDDWLDELDGGTADAPDGTTIPTADVSLRRVLSHTAGLRAGSRVRVGEDAVYDVSCDAAPSEWLSGLVNWDGTSTCDFYFDNNTVEALYWDPTIDVGEKVQYSNRGSYLAQVFLEDLTGKSGPVLAEQLLFDPLDLDDISGRYPVPDALLDRHAGHYDIVADTENEMFQHPMAWPSGFVSSTPDLAEVVAVAIRDGEDAFGNQLVGKDAIVEMMTPIELNDRTTRDWGLGLVVRGKARRDGSKPVFRVGGQFRGGAQGAVCGDRDQGAGIVIVANSSGDDDELNPFFEQILEDFDDEYGTGCTK